MSSSPKKLTPLFTSKTSTPAGTPRPHSAAPAGVGAAAQAPVRVRVACAEAGPSHPIHMGMCQKRDSLWFSSPPVGMFSSKMNQSYTSTVNIPSIVTAGHHAPLEFSFWALAVGKLNGGVSTNRRSPFRELNNSWAAAPAAD